MNREIKFRAWDKDSKCWYTPTHAAYKGELFELLIGFMGDLNAHTMEGLEHQSLWPNRFELMQYTGLKDKNGVEIYEGDIVKILYTDWASQENYHILQVVYEAPTFELMNKGHSLYPIEPGTHGYIEVIGNIYSNPELLEGSNDS